MKSNLVRVGSLFMVAPLLMSFTNGTTMSNVYGKTISPVVDVVARGQSDYVMTSTRNDEMASFTIYYEILKMDHVVPASSWKNGYSINYRLDVQLETNVSYANGLFKWFTGHDDTKLVHNYIYLNFNSLPSDVAIINNVDTSFYNPFKVCLPSQNGGTTVNVSTNSA